LEAPIWEVMDRYIDNSRHAAYTTIEAVRNVGKSSLLWIRDEQKEYSQLRKEEVFLY